MNARRFIMTPAIVAAVVIGSSSAQERAADDAEDPMIIIRATEGCFPWMPDSRADGDAIYMASSANGWDPSAFQGSRFIREHDQCRPLYTPVYWDFRIPSSVAGNRSFEFKFTRGSWKTVEVDLDGRDIPNRTLLVFAGSDEDVSDDGLTVYYMQIPGFADQRDERWPELEESNSTITGHLDIFDHASDVLSNTRKIRVWTPPGYRSLELADQRYPVLYMHDGQNLFDTATSFIGVEWGVDETLTELITSGTVPPMIVVGIDNAGKDRAKEYVPDTLHHARVKGNAYEFIAMLLYELMPLINNRYRTLGGPENTAMGGSSYGGVITLTAAMRLPGVFGAILVESPSLGVGEGKFLDMVKAHDNWPQRVYIAMGTAENKQNNGTNERFVRLTRELETALRANGLDDSRLRVVIEEGARHNEEAWARRLPDALRFLFGK